jgi:hypothetical protein
VTAQQVRSALLKIDHVETRVHGVRNDIVDVGDHAVIVRSERTGTARPISFEEILDWKSGKPNSSVKRALARAVGLPGA